MPDSEEDLLRVRSLEILALLPRGIVLGILTGAAVNVVNIWISPNYFRFKYQNSHDASELEVLAECIRGGMKEYLIFAFISSFILMIAIGFISKMRCPLQLSKLIQIRIVVFSLIFGFVGGFNGVLSAHFQPHLFGMLIGVDSYLMPRNPIDALKFAWVAGSIQGIYFGSILSTIGALSSFARKWHQLEKQAPI